MMTVITSACALPDDRTSEVTAFAESAEWTGVTVDDRETWLRTRREMVTASDVAAILGEDEYRSPLHVYADKVLAQEPDVVTIDDPRFWGTVLEQPVLRAVATYRGWTYRPGGALLRSRRHPHVGATLDAEVDRGDGWLVFEGKTTRVPKGWHQDKGELPTRVLIQTQAQLLVTGAPMTVVFALLQGSRPCQIDVYPSEEFHAIVVEETERFLERVRQLDPPPPIMGVSARDAQRRLHPNEDGTVVDLPPEAVDWTREYQEIGRQIKAFETRQEYLADLLRASIGKATWGVLPAPIGGKSVWRYQLEKRAGYTVEPTEFRKLLAMKERK